MLKTIVKCPNCDQKLRVPEDRGSILVTCDSCSLKWMFSPDTPATEKSSGTGLKSWLGKTARSLTGGMATLDIIDIEDGVGESPRMVRVRVTVAKEPVAMQALKLQTRCEETITLPSGLVRIKRRLEDTSADEQTNHRVKNGEIDHCETTYDGTFELNGPENLDAKSSSIYSGPIQLPETAQPTFVGRYIANQWIMRAVLETSSGLVNPKSEWVMLPVS